MPLRVLCYSPSLNTCRNFFAHNIMHCIAIASYSTCMRTHACWWAWHKYIRDVSTKWFYGNFLRQWFLPQIVGSLATTFNGWETHSNYWRWLWAPNYARSWTSLLRCYCILQRHASNDLITGATEHSYSLGRQGHHPWKYRGRNEKSILHPASESEHPAGSCKEQSENVSKKPSRVHKDLISTTLVERCCWSSASVLLE